MQNSLNYIARIKSETLSINFIKQLVQAGGPNQEQYDDLSSWFSRCNAYIEAGQVTSESINMLKEAFGDAMTTQTMQGFSYCKPHGYAGDYEIIDGIYLQKTSQNPHLAKWDNYFHSQHASRAVRNRKTYFHQLLDQVVHRNINGKVLKVAMGPGRSMYEWLCKNPDSMLKFDCLDIDANAIEYAKTLNHQFLDRIQFIHKNALRFKPKQKYDLIWSAGLFDYFDDETFVRLLERLLPYVNDGGELVVGNFGEYQPSKPYMEVAGNWKLNYRSAQKLIELAQRAGAKRESISIGCEPLAVNLFMHIKVEDEVVSINNISQNITTGDLWM